MSVLSAWFTEGECCHFSRMISHAHWWHHRTHEFMILTSRPTGQVFFLMSRPYFWCLLDILHLDASGCLSLSTSKTTSSSLFPLPLLTSSSLFPTLVHGNSAHLTVQVKNSAAILPPYPPSLTSHSQPVMDFVWAISSWLLSSPLSPSSQPASVQTPSLSAWTSTRKEWSFRGCREI